MIRWLALNLCVFTSAKVLRIDENIQIQPPSHQQQTQQQQMQMQNEIQVNANSQNGEDTKPSIVVVKTEKPVSTSTILPLNFQLIPWALH